MNIVNSKSKDLTVYRRKKNRTQEDRENDYEDSTFWYNSRSSNSNLNSKEKLKPTPSDASTILQYIKGLTHDNIKDQDHYLVLGLDHLRYQATEAQIKSAYRKACLLFHPDRHHSQYELDYSQFVYITKAYEVLSDPEKRQSYDSIDSCFDDSVPSVVDSKENFYDVFGAAFYRNARWSIEQPVPLLGDENTSYNHAQKFYTFWKNFRSNRNFSYLDEQPVESGDCREERRYIAKMNKKKHEELKKNEMKRIRQLVDNCRACDPRISTYMQIKAEIVRKEKEDRKKQQKQKKASKITISSSQTQDQSIVVEKKASPNNSLTKEKQQLQKNEEKEEKMFLKKQMANQKIILRKYVESHNYFIRNVNIGDEKLKKIEEFDHFLKIVSLNDIKQLNQQMETMLHDFDACLNLYSTKVKQYDSLNCNSFKNTEKIIKNKKFVENKTLLETNTLQTELWTKEKVSVLMKALKQYPAGTKSRYEIVTDYVNKHVGSNFNVKQIIQQVKTMTVNQDTNVVKMVNDSINSSANVALSSQSFKKNTITLNNPSSHSSSNCEWTTQEQKILQQALKDIPIGTDDRWNKISSLIPLKSPLQCQQRVKFLCELIKKKKLNSNN